jgi:LPS-assembly lipoprotein
MIQLKHLLIPFALLLLSACGYHLRGSTDLPESLKVVYLQGGSFELRNAFMKTLRGAKGKLVDKVADAGLVIQIIDERTDRRVISLSAKGRVNEFELIYSLFFILRDNAGKVLSEKQRIEVRRDYYNDQGDVLGKNNEEQVIKQEMYRQVTKSIFYRARVVLERKALKPNALKKK